MTDFYRILSKQVTDNTAVVHIELNPDCKVYEGHFPGLPIAPGMCHLEMIRECASLVWQQAVRFGTIKRLKFMQPIDPRICTLLTLTLTREGQNMTALLVSGEQDIVKLKATI